MTEKANPSINRPAEAFKTAGALAYGGHGGGSYQGFVIDGASPTENSVQDANIVEANLNSFAQTSGGASLDVTIDPGEAFVYGAWVAIDSSTTVTLSASTAAQTVYVGWNKDGTDDVIVGLSSAFASASGDTDEKIPLFDFTTDGSGVTSVTDRRRIGFGVDIDDKVYFNDGAASISYDGTNIVFSGSTISESSIEQGAGSGLDADTLDGVQLANITWTDIAISQSDINVSDLGAADATYDTNGNDIVDGAANIYDASAGHISQEIVEQGAASGLNADQVDGIHAASFLRSDVADSFNSTITGNAVLDMNTTNGRVVLPVGVDKYAV